MPEEEDEVVVRNSAEFNEGSAPPFTVKDLVAWRLDLIAALTNIETVHDDPETSTANRALLDDAKTKVAGVRTGINDLKNYVP